MYTYPESMVDKTITDYKKMEEGGTTNPLSDDERSTSTAVTIPTGLSKNCYRMILQNLYLNQE